MQNPNDRRAIFRRIWAALAERGQCDGWGGTESERVYAEWVAAGWPWPISRFIRRRANAAVDGSDGGGE